MMIIKVGNSVSFLSKRLPNYILWDINKNTCYKDETIFFKTKNWKLSVTNLFNEEELSFPTGLMRRVCKVLQMYNIPFKIEDNRKIPQNGKLSLTTKIEEPKAYSDQDAALRALSESPSGRGICVLPTGVGKTRVMKDLIQKLGVHTLVVEPGVNLKKQVCDYLEACFGPVVGEFSKVGELSPITVCNLDALTNCPKERLAQFDCVIFDEYHHEACATARMINEVKLDDIYYKYAFTATNFRNNKNEMVLLESVMSNEVYSISPLCAIDRGYIVPISYYRQDIQDKPPENFDTGPFAPSEAELSDMWERQKKGMKYHRVYKKFITLEDERNEKIIAQAQDLMQKGIQTLILVKEIAHGELLHQELSDSVFVNGSQDKAFNFSSISDFNSSKIPIIIGTSVIGEGIDTKSAGAVILGNAEKAESKIMQNIGRVVRTFPGKDRGLVFDYNDLGHETTAKHSKKRAKIIKKHFGESHKASF
jgi:superfamily II DNA or RNA helicase